MTQHYHQHDRTLKSLFSHPQMVESLLRGFIKEEWVDHLDFDSLEPCKNSYVSKDLKERIDDSVWRLRFDKEWLYLYIIIEFQRKVDRWMAIRLMSYIGLLYEDIIKAQQLTSKDYLPPVFPFVFFNGNNTWTAPLSSTQLLSPAVPPSLKYYFPSFQYRLLDVAHHTLTPAECNDSDNLIIPLIQLEQNVKSFAAASVCLEALIKQLESPAYDSLRHAFALYLSRSMNIDQHCPGIDLEQLDLGDIKMTLMERLQAHADQQAAQAMEQGIQKGVKQGVQHMEKRVQRGMKQGVQQGMKQAALKMLAMQVADEALIKKMFGFTKKEIDALRSKVSENAATSG